MTEKTRFSKKSFAVIILAGIFLPFIARIPGIFVRGMEYFLQYLFSIGVTLLITISNIIPFVILAIISYFTYNRLREAVIVAGIFLFGFDLFIHASLDLTSSSTAGIAFVFIPIWLCIVIPVGYGLGWFAGFLLRRKKSRPTFE